MFVQVSSRQLFVLLQPINLVKTYLDSCANTDFLSGLHNCLEFCQPLYRLYQAMQTRKTFSIV